jgi:hypothetical protein
MFFGLPDPSLFYTDPDSYQNVRSTKLHKYSVFSVQQCQCEPNGMASVVNVNFTIFNLSLHFLRKPPVLTCTLEQLKCI